MAEFGGLGALALAWGCVVGVNVGELESEVAAGSSTGLGPGAGSESGADPGPGGGAGASTSGSPSATTGADADTATASSESGGSESGSDAEARAFALSYEDLARLDEGDATTASSDGGTATEGDIPPDALRVSLVRGEPHCGDPDAPLQCGGQWLVEFTLLPSEQVVGAAGRLEDHNLFVFEQGEPFETDPNECGGGGGNVGSGAFEITAIDDEVIRGTLTGLDVAFPPFVTDMQFTAERC